ncbi:MAG: hypothetical protein Ct9H300mP20_04750 [Gammaproteobacteria bacterium]|nr:MAG: hypothetical protein Ct9H300mP20_04750 [Gammaproteobacteria bacterium]
MPNLAAIVSIVLASASLAMSISVFKNNLSHSYLGDARLYIIFEDYNYLWFIKEKLFQGS